MKRLGIFTLVMVGFIAGIAFVYSCGGGGGSTVDAQLASPNDIRSFYADVERNNIGADGKHDLYIVPSGYNFIITDICAPAPFQINSKNVETRFATNSSNTSGQYHFQSGVVFYSGETIEIALGVSGNIGISLSGYLVES